VITYNRLPCQWYGVGAIAPSRQAQATRNFNLGRMAEWMDECACPPLLIPEGAMRPSEERNFTGSPGQKVKIYDPARRPEWMPPPAFPNMSEFMSAGSDLDAIMNIPAVAKGVSPVTDRISGVAVDGLVAKHQEALGKSLREIVRALEHISKVGLYIAAAKYVDSRVFYILGKVRTQAWFQIGDIPTPGVPPDNSLSLDKFRRMVESGCDVVVEADPGAPMTRAERRRELFGLFQTIGATPPPLWPVLFQFLGYGLTEDLTALLGMGAFSQMMGMAPPQDLMAQAAQQAQRGGMPGGNGPMAGALPVGATPPIGAVPGMGGPGMGLPPGMGAVPGGPMGTAPAGGPPVMGPGPAGPIGGPLPGMG
jgi:hypothetical protein